MIYLDTVVRVNRIPFNSQYTKVENKIKKEQLSQDIKSILFEQLYGILATSYKHQPYTSLLAFVASSDIKHIFLATGKGTHKFHNLLKNRNIAFFIDTRSNRTVDISDAFALTAIGKADPIESNQKEQVKNRYLQRHPQLNHFINAEHVELIQLTIASYTLVKRFQEVFILDLDEQ